MLSFTLHAKGTTGNGRQYIAQTADMSRAFLEFEVEAVGATPTVTFQVEGLVPGGNPATAADWFLVALSQADATIAISNAPIVVTAVGKTRRFIAGLDVRAFDALAITTSANTNVTYSSRLYAR